VAHPAPSDAELIAASWETASAFEAVFERHFDAVFRFLSVRVGRDEAEDLAAETFALAFRARRRYRLEYPSARPWLLGIAANLARQGARARRRAATAMLKLKAREVPAVDPADEAAARADAGRQQRRLAAAFASLSPKERDVVALLVHGGLTQQETARALGIPVGTVKSRMAKARERLREQVGPQGPIDTVTTGEAQKRGDDG
jgi:RNA polymerase sigma-70 factor (ECF subfamily)